MPRCWPWPMLQMPIRRLECPRRGTRTFPPLKHMLRSRSSTLHPLTIPSNTHHLPRSTSNNTLLFRQSTLLRSSSSKRTRAREDSTIPTLPFRARRSAIKWLCMKWPTKKQWPMQSTACRLRLQTTRFMSSVKDSPDSRRHPSLIQTSTIANRGN